MDLWAYTNGVILDFSRRGKPTDNAAIESFSGRFREECLNVHWFASMDDAQQKIDAFRWDYNEHHPHRSPGPQPSGIRRKDAPDGRGLTLRVNQETEAPQTSHLQGLVAMQVDLVEMLQVVVPMTRWWTERKITKVLGRLQAGQTIEEGGTRYSSRFETQPSGERQHVVISPDDRFLALAGLLLWAPSSKNVASIPRTPRPASKR